MTIFCSFNPELALRKLQGKRVLFVGDSLQRNQWESFVCLVEWVIPHKHKSMQLGRVHSVFTAKVLIHAFNIWSKMLTQLNQLLT